jgi:ATP-dependent DNA helicase RecG
MDLVPIIAGMRRNGAEFEDVEVKRASGGVPETLPSTMSAFANAKGGIIILGLDERRGFAANGVADAPAVRDAVAGFARGSLTPPLAPSIDIMTFEGAQLVVTEIEPLSPEQRPCYVTSRGLYGGSYLRVGDGDQRLTAYEIDRLREAAGQPRWDTEPVAEATVADLDPRHAARLVEAARRRSVRAFAGLDDTEALTRLGVLARHGGELVPTLAGLLSVGVYPQQFFPQLMITTAVFPHAERDRPGPGGVRFLDSATVTGAIPDMVADAIDAVQRNLRVVSRIIGAGRQDQWEIEPAVIREAIVNAVMHRDYSPASRGTQVQVEIFPDRVTVSSPGGLFGNVRIDTLGLTEATSSRNARLAVLLQEAADPVTGRPVAENRGSGVSMMISQVRHDTGVVPLFAASLDQFRVTIPRSSPVTAEFLAWAGQHLPGQLSAAQLAMIAIARTGHDVDLALLRRLAPDHSDPRAELADLIDHGVLQSRKARDDGPYRISPLLRNAPAPEAVPAPPEGDLASRALTALGEVPSASREELQEVLGISRSRTIRLLQNLINTGRVTANDPPTSPNRRYQLVRPADGSSSKSAG